MSSDEGKTNTAAAATAQAGAASASKDQNVQMMANVNNGEQLQEPEGPSGIEASDALGRQLKKVYGKLLSEPVPDKFFELLRRLDQVPPGGKPDSGSKGT